MAKGVRSRVKANKNFYFCTKKRFKKAQVQK